MFYHWYYKLPNDLTWYVDMGTTQHICYEKKSFMNYETCKSWQVVFLNDNKTQQIVGLREIAIKLIDGKARKIHNVLHVFSF